MKTNTSIICVASICVAALLSPAHAVLVLAVDFNEINNTVTSNTETNFQAYNIDRSVSSPRSQAFVTGSGSITVDLPNGSTSSRDRGLITETGTFTYSDLFRDGAAQILSSTASLRISGLSASTDYSIQIWSLNKGNDNGATFEWFDRTPTTFSTPGTEVSIGTIVNSSSPAPTSNDEFSLTATVKTNELGVLTFRQTATSGTGFINGFALNTIPEPSSALLAMIGSLALLRRRRA